MPPNWPVDGHVHFHSLDRVGQTLDAAVGNFQSVNGRTEGLLGALLLSQASREHAFEALAELNAIAGWKITRVTGEPETLIARKAAASIAIVCGRQVRARDGLEVLALGTVKEFPDGMRFSRTIDELIQSGALTVIPWGFGKWMGARRRPLEDALQAANVDTLFLGDNGSRLNWLGVPALIQEGEQRGFRVLPGTDPFPFAGDYRRVGRFGFLAAAAPLESAPWHTLREWLIGLAISPTRYGHACGPVRFITNQVGIQFHNRISRARPA